MDDKLNFIIQPLDVNRHIRDDFDCGVAPLNHFLRTQARKEADAQLGVCFVAVPEGEHERIAGYYTLSAATVIRTELPEDITKKLPKYRELPATLLGRLARALPFKGSDLGPLLLMSAIHRSVRASQEVASWAIVTDPKDEFARGFYARFGFRSLTADRMFLPMKDAKALVNAL